MRSYPVEILERVAAGTYGAHGPMIRINGLPGWLAEPLHLCGGCGGNRWALVETVNRTDPAAPRRRLRCPACCPARRHRGEELVAVLTLPAVDLSGRPLAVPAAGG